MASDYWRKRAEADMDAVQDAASIRINRIRQAHLQAAEDLTAQVEKIIGTYARRFDLTPEEAKKILLAPFDEDSRAYGYRMTRAEALRQAAQEQAAKLQALERREVEAQRHYTAGESARQADALLTSMGAHTGFGRPDTGGLMRSINTRWSGASYSESIWSNTSQLAEMLEREVTAAFLGGKSNRAIAELIDKSFNSGFRVAERLVRTETSYVNNQAALIRYEDAGIIEYEILTANNPCPKCAKLNGNKILLRLAEVGVNMPPLHPWCRCTVLPVVPEMNDKARDLVYNRDGDLASDGTQQGVNIEIDEFTPCLRKLDTNTIVQTSMERVSPERSEFPDWEFDWSRPERFGYEVFALKADGDDRIQGMIALKPVPYNYAVHVELAESAPHNNMHLLRKQGKAKEYDGVGAHLFAEACRQSYDLGYGGFVYFRAKTDLISHYQTELGARLINPQERVMAIDEAAAIKLIKRYYGGE